MLASKLQERIVIKFESKFQNNDTLNLTVSQCLRWNSKLYIIIIYISSDAIDFQKMSIPNRNSYSTRLLNSLLS